MKGFFKLKPTNPKYQATWDVRVVLKFLRKKLQTLSKIKTESIRKTREGLKIFVPDTIKTSGLGKFLPMLDLPKFRKKPELVVKRILYFFRFYNRSG